MAMAAWGKDSLKDSKCSKKAKQKLLENALGKTCIFKTQRKLKPSFTRKISGFHESGQKQKQGKQVANAAKKFFSHLEFVEDIFFVFDSAK